MGWFGRNRKLVKRTGIALGIISALLSIRASIGEIDTSKLTPKDKSKVVMIQEDLDERLEAIKIAGDELDLKTMEAQIGEFRDDVVAADATVGGVDKKYIIRLADLERSVKSLARQENFIRTKIDELVFLVTTESHNTNDPTKKPDIKLDNLSAATKSKITNLRIEINKVRRGLDPTAQEAVNVIIENQLETSIVLHSRDFAELTWKDFREGVKGLVTDLLIPKKDQKTPGEKKPSIGTRIANFLKGIKFSS
ncbi:MAG TPA: hypothetical protein VJI68_01070 [Candidatus Nanoarchaeia archaeon]|nr:hypothetical protein [Candidatus Nanoarchaeia archaeon]